MFRDAMAVLDRKILHDNTKWGQLPRPLFSVRLALAAARRWLMWAAVALFGFRADKRQQAKATAPALEARWRATLAQPAAARDAAAA